jgi:hypothetical protein
MNHVLSVIEHLERHGCQVVGAAVLPTAQVHINPPPAGVIRTYAYRDLPAGAWAAPVECVALLDGVRVSWWQGGVRHV